MVTNTTGVTQTVIAPSAAMPAALTLSPGDSAGLTSRFGIVPEAGTLLLGGMGLLGLWIGWRRRS